MGSIGRSAASRGVRAWAGLCAGLIAAVPACAGWGGAGEGRAPSAEALDSAIERALAHLEADPDLSPPALLVVDPLRRWYGLDVFPDLQRRYRLAILRGNDPRLDGERQAPYLRVMRRVIHPMEIQTGGGLRWEEFAQGMLDKGGINVLTMPALFCDQIPYPEGYPEILAQGARAGGYELTHVALALQWIAENDCEPPVEDGFAASVAEAIGELPDLKGGVTDLELEATAFLMYLGRRDLIPPGFVAAVVGTQRADGGWSHDSADPSLESRWHPTVLALWALLGARHPGVVMTPMVVPGRER